MAPRRSPPQPRLPTTTTAVSSGSGGGRRRWRAWRRCSSTKNAKAAGRASKRTRRLATSSSVAADSGGAGSAVQRPTSEASPPVIAPAGVTCSGITRQAGRPEKPLHGRGRSRGGDDGHRDACEIETINVKPYVSTMCGSVARRPASSPHHHLLITSSSPHHRLLSELPVFARGGAVRYKIRGRILD